MVGDHAVTNACQVYARHVSKTSIYRRWDLRAGPSGSVQRSGCSQAHNNVRTAAYTGCPGQIFGSTNFLAIFLKSLVLKHSFKCLYN